MLYKEYGTVCAENSSALSTHGKQPLRRVVRTAQKCPEFSAGMFELPLCTKKLSCCRLRDAPYHTGKVRSSLSKKKTLPDAAPPVS
ncbi:hypothetical protein Y032_0011g1408 [Ancylostoma ceylanicum]|uniref:Uncharacterized protein n=1 Tax=Ancylostoma ceylanicum TaxID=53326 RepID=A0A016VEU9_9BILA|nr:hypothetical protein Y032_0011g1408 [Ancylostoma ceylanicum]